MNSLLKDFLLILAELLETHPSNDVAIHALKDKADTFRQTTQRNDGSEDADLVGLVLIKAALAYPPETISPDTAQSFGEPKAATEEDIPNNRHVEYGDGKYTAPATAPYPAIGGTKAPEKIFCGEEVVPAAFDKEVDRNPDGSAKIVDSDPNDRIGKSSGIDFPSTSNIGADALAQPHPADGKLAGDNGPGASFAIGESVEYLGSEAEVSEGPTVINGKPHYILQFPDGGSDLIAADKITKKQPKSGKSTGLHDPAVPIMGASEPENETTDA